MQVSDEDLTSPMSFSLALMFWLLSITLWRILYNQLTEEEENLDLVHGWVTSIHCYETK